MIREALEYLIGLGNTRIENVGNRIFSTQKIYAVEEPTPATIQVHSLSGLFDYLQSKFDGDYPLMVHIKSPTEVIAFTSINRDSNRDEFIKASAMLPSFSFDRWYDTEDFNIKLQSCFVKNEDRDIMLKVVGNIKEEAVSTIGDNGVSQSVVAKTGVATVANVVVPNPVVLKPYRTFVEVDQPESEFIFRMQSGPKCALFEADGGAWKLQAMKNIKAYLERQLETEIQSRKLVIIA
ncbi:hypothetical protein [Effusibacillus consociatus]|uniref:Phage-related protein n=1 Tax=Effusibacillus consociatus TaxID=1117041 RepID=A0ABV9Q4J4_9BACL